MSYSLYRQAAFPSYKGGLATVGYALYNADGTLNTARTTTGVAERGTSTGIYGATVTFSDTFVGEIRWDTGDASPLYASEEVGPQVLSPVSQPFATGSVASAPTTIGFRGDSGMSSTDNFYHGSEFTFTSGTCKGLTRVCVSYVGSTRAVGFSNALAAAPSVNDTFVIKGGNG